MIDSAADLHCYACEYNLRGLPADGKCPECGEPISASRTARDRQEAQQLFARNTLAPFAVRLVIGMAVILIAIVALGPLFGTLHYTLQPIGGLTAAFGAALGSGVIGLAIAWRSGARARTAAKIALLAAVMAVVLCVYVAGPMLLVR